MINPLYIQKYKLTAGQRKITLHVKGYPIKLTYKMPYYSMTLPQLIIQ